MTKLFQRLATAALALAGVSCSHTGIGSADYHGLSASPSNATQDTVTLNVPFVSQPASSNWCWAASGEMISAFLGERVATETQVDERFARLDIKTRFRSDAERARHSLAGWPELNRFGFESDFTREPLSFEKIENELKVKNRPLAWAYGRGEGLGHMVVVVGCRTTDSGKRYLYVQNPNANGGTDRVSYDFYARSEGWGRHIRTYYNFSKDDLPSRSVYVAAPAKLDQAAPSA